MKTHMEMHSGIARTPVPIGQSCESVAPDTRGSSRAHGSRARSFLRVAGRGAAVALLVTAGLSSAMPARAAAVCERTEQVRTAIVDKLSGINDCADVTDAHLASVGELEFRGGGGVSLVTFAAGDLDGLTGMSSLTVEGTESQSARSLPDGIFDDLVSLEELSLVRSGLSSLPADVFDKLASLEELSLAENSLTSLPEGIFDELDLSFLDLSDNGLASTSFRDGVFESLTELDTLLLDGNPDHDDVVPTSLPGAFREVLGAETVTLDGSASGGPWGTNVTYAWFQSSGTPVTIVDPSAPIQSFVAPTTGGDLTFTLDVETRHVGHDNHHYTDVETVRIRVLPGPAVTNVAIASSAGTYAIGDEIRVSVTYTEPVTVTSTPQAVPHIELDIGGRARQARYDDGDGTNTLVFAYTVVEGDEDTDGIALNAETLSVPAGSSIVGDDSGLSAWLRHPAIAPDAGHTVDGVRPAVTSANVNGTVLVLAYDESLDTSSVPSAADFAVMVDGAAADPAGTDPVVVDGSTVTLNLASPVMSTGTVTVSYTVPTGANAAPIRDEEGNDAAALASLAVDNHSPGEFPVGTLRLVNGSTPNEGRLEMYYANEWGTICDDYWTDDEADVACKALGYERGAVDNGGRFLGGYFGFAERGVPIWLDNVNCEGDETNLLDCPRASQRGSIPGVGVHNCSLWHTEDVGVRCNADPLPPLPPRVTGAPEVGGPPGSDGLYDAHETVEVAVVFDEVVTVDTSGGTPSIAILPAGRLSRDAGYVRGSGTTRLVFEYTLTDDDVWHALLPVSYEVMGVLPNTLRLNGGSIRSEAGAVDADLAHAGVDVEPAEIPVLKPTKRVTVGLRDFPLEHDGSTVFEFQIVFSEEVEISRRTVRRFLIDVTGGTIPNVFRLEKGSNIGWRVKVMPSSTEDIRLYFNSTTSCQATGAVCTSDGRMLESNFEVTINGPAALSVSDARVEEGPGAALSFEVVMSRSRDEEVRVDYATRDGSALAGDDYVADSGTLVFAPGETSKTVEIEVLDDEHNEGVETFALELSNAQGARIADGTATGTIENSDAMPKAWLARFGRTVGAQIVDVVGSRLERRGRNDHVTVGGARLGGSVPTESLEVTGDSGSDPWWIERDGARSLGPRELLTRSAFHLSEGGDEGAPTVSAWGRFATDGFDSRVEDLRLRGSVTTGLLGADVEHGDVLAGAALGLTRGEGSYRRGAGDRDSWTVRSDLTTVSPYVRYEASERIALWGLAGIGSGELTLRSDEQGRRSIRTGMSTRLGAVGATASLATPSMPDGTALDLKADALFVRTESDAVQSGDAGNLLAASGGASRLRLVLEGARTLDLGEDRTVVPALALGIRHDGGDAETGTGMEAGVSVQYADPAWGLTVDGRLRMLLAHEDSGYREWGASGSVRVDPGVSGRGFSLTIAPEWGNASDGVDRLWDADLAPSLARADGFEARSRLETEIGYGVGLAGNRGVLTPYAGLSIGRGDSGSLRAGARWKLADDVSLDVEGAHHEDRGQALTLRAALRF